MPIRDLGAQNASLDNDYGTTRGPHAASSHTLALLDADGAELTDVNSPGYARAAVPPTAWDPADEGSKTAEVVLPAPTDEWEPAVSWRLHGSDGLIWDECDLEETLLITSAGPAPEIAITVFYDPTS